MVRSAKRWDANTEVQTHRASGEGAVRNSIGRCKGEHSADKKRADEIGTSLLCQRTQRSWKEGSEGGRNRGGEAE